jgi:hypothetical protein
MFLIRLVLLPFRLALTFVTVTLRTTFRIGRLPGRLSARVTRLVGLKAWVLFGVGLAIGLLFAPGPGRELRARITRLFEKDAGGDDDIESRVRFELAHAPRTWHLDQPDIAVVDGRVRLRGTSATSDDRHELARVAAAIPGVMGVDNQLTVAAGVDGASGDAGSNGDGGVA